jgi:probable HAF family extracellular repeat protein
MDMKISLLVLAIVFALAANDACKVSAQSYTVSSIGPIGNTWSRPYAVNDRGQAVGVSYITSNSGWAFVYDSTNGVRLLPALAGSSKAQANAINHAGQVVGYCTSPSGSITAFLWDSTNGTRRIDQIADSAGVTAASLGWTIGSARAINARGDILCWASSGPAIICVWRMTAEPSGATALSVSAVPNVTELSDTNLNDIGVVLTTALNPSTGAYAFGLWDSYAGNFNLFIEPSFQQGSALNNLGVAVSHYGQIYQPGSGVTLLGSLGSGSAEAWYVNDANQVVGFSRANGRSGVNLAFLWQNGVMKNLQSLTNADKNWTLNIAGGMSNPTNSTGTAGFVVGWGTYKTQAVGWILSPK